MRFTHKLAWLFSALLLLVSIGLIYARYQAPKASAFVIPPSMINPARDGIDLSLDASFHTASNDAFKLSPTAFTFDAFTPFAPSFASYYPIANPTPSAHASSIIALDPLATDMAFMAVFFAGSREGARDVAIYQSFFHKKHDEALNNALIHHASNQSLSSFTPPPPSSSPTSLTPLYSSPSPSHSPSPLAPLYSFAPYSFAYHSSPSTSLHHPLHFPSLIESSHLFPSHPLRSPASLAPSFNPFTPSSSMPFIITPFISSFASPPLALAPITSAHASYEWSKPTQLLNAQELSSLSGTFIRKLGNPLIVKDGTGRVNLFVVGVSLGGWATSKIYWLIFDESLRHLSFHKALHLSPFANLSTLVRAPALLLSDGGFFLPIYHELARKYPILLHIDTHLSLDAFLPLPHISSSTLQPSFAPLSPHLALGVYRSYMPSTMLASLCALESSFICRTLTSNLKNFNSSSILFHADGYVFLLHNTPDVLAPFLHDYFTMNRPIMPSSTPFWHSYIVFSAMSNALSFATHGIKKLLPYVDLGNPSIPSSPNALASTALLSSPFALSAFASPSSSPFALSALFDESSLLASPSLTSCSFTPSFMHIGPMLTSSILPYARNALTLFVLDATSLASSCARFIPLASIDYASSEVSYPSVALSRHDVFITYTYKRAYIKSLLLSRDALFHLATRTLNAYHAHPMAHILTHSAHP